jgi:hypothetical protein
LFVLAAGLIIGALHLLFRRDEKPAVHHAKGTCLDVTSLRSA